MTGRIDHAGAAGEMLTTVANTATEASGDDEVRIILAEAQVHATLALVEQQRIANLIAVYVADGAAESGFIGKGFDFGYMADQIREGLGL